jgi:cell pole-organizing protein PopZ
MRPSFDEQDDDLTYPAQQPASAGHYDHDPYGAPPAEQHYGYEQPHGDGYGEPYDQQGYGQPRMLSHNAEAATADAFRHLYDSLLSRGLGDRSVEDMTRELLRGMLKQWLDDNLPSLVERLVRDEISRVARNGR